jgi:2-oxoisovalerate dehydrogenase E2 component (dihydrolipoyl transacylase)
MPSVVMPQPGQSVTEGTVVKWLKQVGDQVAADEVLVEVETEKVNVEVPSPFEGTLTEILAQEGVGAFSAPPPPAAPAAGEPRPDGDGGRPAAVAPGVGAGAAPTASPTVAVRRNGAGSDATASRYSPAVLRLAAEHNLDLSRIPGSGMGGRVTRKDVVQFLERGEPQAATAGAATAAPPAPAITTSPGGVKAAGIAEERELATTFTQPAGPATMPPPAAPPPSASPAPRPEPVAGEDEEVIRPSPTRLTIARNMLRTAQTVPSAWMVVEVDVTGLVRLRQRQREAFRAREGVDLTYLPFVVQVVTAALREHPMLNSEWRDDQIVLKKRINLGIAVGVEEGLIVPVIHHADRLSLTGLAHTIDDLATRARAKKLKLEDVTGGTFTLDNTGVFGSLVSQPIINPPQAAILSTEAIVQRPVVVEESIAVRSIMNLCITFDHRIVDGSHVGPFMQAIKRRLEAFTPESLLT